VQPLPLLPNMVRAVGYRVIPQERTTYYQSGSNSSFTSCFGQGQFFSFGNYGNINMNTNCNTTYTTPTQIPVTWRFADVYVAVEGTVSRRLPCELALEQLHASNCWRCVSH